MFISKLNLASLVLVGAVSVAPARTGEQGADAAMLAQGRSCVSDGIRSEAFGDYNDDGRVDLDDYAHWTGCMAGPDKPPYAFGCDVFDAELDGDVDLRDYATFQSLLIWCELDAECDDDLFCSGLETCDTTTGTCDPAAPPCTPDETCDEDDDICVPITTCGDSVVDEGEECDDGNTTSGDGCDENCRRETPGPQNDYCANAIIISDGATAFDTTDATTDGPEEPSCGFMFDDPQIGSDIWFCYTATCSGELVVSLCGGDYDSKIGVYPGCDCPTGTPITCSDDDCGAVGVDSRTTLQATAQASYLIRIGGYLGDRGTGTLRILCGVEPCGPGQGDCFTVHEGIGCEDEACCNTTCEIDPYCCDAMWDQYCADEASGLCTGSFPACAPGAGSCAIENETPGCDDIECCNTVCMIDPYCCVDTWDETCANEAFVPCRLACGGLSGGCFTANTTPGCSDVDCCEAVCDIDEFCCDIVWDEACVDIAAGEAADVCRGAP